MRSTFGTVSFANTPTTFAYCTRILVLSTACMISHVAIAKIIPWTPNVPSSLTPFHGHTALLADLTGDRIFIYPHPKTTIQLPNPKYTKPHQQAQFYSAAVILPVSEAQIKARLVDYKHYVGLFPTLKSAKLLDAAAGIQQVKYQVHIPTPIPILNFKENVTLQHHMTSNSISSLIVDAPIPYGAGKIEWFALTPQKTLVTITQWGDLNQPKGFLFSKILNALPEMKLGIPSATNAFVLEALAAEFKPTHQRVILSKVPLTPLLSTMQLQQIAQLSRQAQQPVSFVLPKTQLQDEFGQENLRFSTTYYYYPQTNAQLQPWIQAQAAKKLFPTQIKKIELHALDTQAQQVKYHLSVGLGVLSIPFDFEMRYVQPTLNQSEFSATGGDLKHIKGRMQLVQHEQGTLLHMTSAMKIHDQAPFLLKAMRSMPYHDMLPALGANTVYALKVQQRLKK